MHDVEKICWLTEDVGEGREHMLDAIRNGGSVDIFNRHCIEVNHVCNGVIVAEANKLDTVDNQACRGRVVMAVETYRPTRCRNLDELGALVHCHRIVCLKPVHSQNGAVSAQCEHLHLRGELMALRAPYTLRDHK